MLKAWCITCTQTPDRQAYADKHFRDLDISVNWWFGFHGKTWGLSHGGGYLSSGHVGLNLSYWALWQHLWYERDNTFLVFEDDAVLCDDFESKFRSKLSLLPKDWQFVYVGHVGMDERPVQERVADGVVRLKDYPVGTHATLINRSALSQLLSESQRLERPVDEQLAKYVMPQLNVYAFDPSLVSQRSCIDWPSLTADSV